MSTLVVTSGLVIKHKRGDTFSQSLVWKVDGVPVSLTGKTGKAEMRSKDDDSLRTSFVFTADADQAANPGVFVLSKSHSDPTDGTRKWAVESAKCDVQFTTTATGAVSSSETFTIRVIADVTE